jgi:hypothetical protein
MRIELLFWAGCPSYPQSLEDLRAALSEAGEDPDAVSLREVHDEAQAASERFIGSPTIRVDGRDVVDPGDQPPALTCRLYFRRDGHPSPVPDPADLREALLR